MRGLVWLCVRIPRRVLVDKVMTVDHLFPMLAMFFSMAQTLCIYSEPPLQYE